MAYLYVDIRYVVDDVLFFFSSRRRHTRFDCDWSSDVCSSDLNLKFLASPQSAGKTIAFAGRQITVEALRPEAFEGVRIVLSSTPTSISREWSPIDRKSVV